MAYKLVSGEQWLRDETTNELVGIKDSVDGEERLVVFSSVNPVTGGIGITKPNGAITTLGATHIKVALLGDSITARATISGTPPIGVAASAISPWHCANWMVGAPFVFAQNLAYSGDTARGIMARIPSVRQDIQCVFVMAGTNDVISMSAAATQGTIDSTYTTVSGYIGAGVAALVSAGKVVVISTILPNSAITPDTNSRIQLLDRLNAYISELASSRVYVVDGFASMWDSAQPTVRVATSGALNADGTHPTSAGALLFGAASKFALKAAVWACYPDVNIYEGFHQQRILYNEFRRSTGGIAGTISAGSGTLADGWRCLQNAGTATFMVDATATYSLSSDYVGPAVAPYANDSYWQTFNVTSAAASDNPRLRTPGADITNSLGIVDGLFGGSEFFMEMDVDISAPVNLNEVSIGYEVTFTSGTSPADQPAYGTTYVRASAGTATDSSSASTAIPASVRYLLRTPVQRVPENINGAATVTAIPFADIKFGGAGSAVVKFGRPRFWHKPNSRAIS